MPLNSDVRPLMSVEPVSFITTETGDDLIVSFAVGDDATEIESLTLIRTPKYERILDNWERGVKISFGGSSHEDEFLDEVHFDAEAAVVRLKSHAATYELDVHRVDRREIKAMCNVLRKMNFDGRVQLSGI